MSVLHLVAKFDGIGGDEYQASFFVDTDPLYDDADFTEVSDELSAWMARMYAFIAVHVETVISAAELIVYLRNLVTGEDSLLGTTDWVFAGTDTNDSLNPISSATVSATVVGNARPAQKRMIPMAENTQDKGFIGTTPQVACALLAAEWLLGPDPTLTYTYEAGIASGTAPQTWKPLDNTAFVRGVLGSVRSRKRGLGI